MQYNVQNPQAAMRIGVVACILFLGQASGTPETAVAGPCYSQDLSVYCTQCPSAAKCDPACSSYGYDPCECPPYPCDPPPFSCPSPGTEYGINICFDPTCTWIGNHAKYIISYGSGWDPAYPLFASFIANDQGETCFDPGCFNDALYPPDEECFIANRFIRSIQPAGPVPCGQVVLDVFATEDEAAWQAVFCEPGEWCGTRVIPGVQGCGGGWYAGAQNVVGGQTSFVTAPVLKECGPVWPQPGDPPREICPGTTICLDLLFYCHEAYLYEAGGCFDLYKKCGASPMTKIDFGDPLGSLLRSGCEFYAVAERPGYSELSLWGEDSWGRPKEGFAPLRYEVVEAEGCELCPNNLVDLRLQAVPLGQLGLNHCPGKCGTSIVDTWNWDGLLDSIQACQDGCSIRFKVDRVQNVELGACPDGFVEVSCPDSCCSNIPVDMFCAIVTGWELGLCPGYNTAECVHTHETGHYADYVFCLAIEAAKFAALPCMQPIQLTGSPPQPTCDEAKNQRASDIMMAVLDAYSEAALMAQAIFGETNAIAAAQGCLLDLQETVCEWAQLEPDVSASGCQRCVDLGYSD